jgi:RNA polymerase sigma factor (sigma-70 family)
VSIRLTAAKFQQVDGESVDDGRPEQRLTEEQFADVVRELSAPLVLYARQLCRHPEDVVQEALLSLRTERVAPTNTRTWLFRVVRHRALNNLRGEERRRKYETEFGRERVAWFESSTSSLDVREAVAALEALPSEERETIVARLWGGLTLGEIATLTNTSLATAQRRYVRGLEKMRESLQVEPYAGLKSLRRKS